ncbi:hypothetical protein N6H14_05980 [Paenibacillus sp. CC-CFT747]|nr:hypothetical protein N6H14_05980 [Paenibacillus sp. CC-CFT747]
MLVERVRIPSLLAGFLALGALAALRPDYVLLLPAAALALVFLFSWRAAVYLLLVCITFNRLSFNVSSTNLRPEMLAVLIGAGAALLFWLSRNKWQNDATVRFTFGAPSIAIALFFVYTYIVSYWNSPVFSYSVAGMVQLALASMGFFVITQAAGFDRDRIHSYVGFYIWLTVFQSVYALVCFLYNKTTGRFLFGEKYGGLMTGQISGVDWSSITWRGGLYEANLFSAYLGAGIVFLVTVIVARVQPRQTLFCSSACFWPWWVSSWAGHAPPGLERLSASPSLPLLCAQMGASAQCGAFRWACCRARPDFRLRRVDLRPDVRPQRAPDLQAHEPVQQRRRNGKVPRREVPIRLGQLAERPPDCRERLFQHQGV